ncbi:hypothetical protein MMC25_005332 [Agyrium rufum]|nr:hypothetical protein [Agyrium rufum]
MAIRINIPPLTRVLLVLVTGFSLVYQTVSYRARSLGATAAASQKVPWITLVPQLSLFYPWVYVTSTLSEQNIVTLLIAGATIFYGGRYLERAWGSTELAKYLVVVTVIPNVIAAFIYVLVFVFIRSDEQAYVRHPTLFYVPPKLTHTSLFGRFTSIQGSISIQAAFLVAFKQLVPEHTVKLLGIAKIRVKHFPAIFLTANTLSGIILGTDTAALLAWIGFLTSWTYLRFFKMQPDISGTSTGSYSSSSLRGDASETFAFAYFWPDVVHRPVSAIADNVYNVLLAMKILRPFSAEEVEESNVQASARGQQGLPTLMSQGGSGGSGRRGGGGASKREEAERRRALALKALDQRLQAASTRGRPQEHTHLSQQQQEQHESQESLAPQVISIPADAEGLGEERSDRKEETKRD